MTRADLRKWRLDRARVWLGKAVELRKAGLFVAAGTAREMCLYYLLRA